MAKSTGLGRGLDSLIPSEVIREQLQDVVPTDQVVKVDVKNIVPNPHQPRQYFSDDSIAELADSLKAHGLIQPIIVVKSGDKYQLIAGERRWRAAKTLNWNKIDAIVRSANEQKQAEMALVENIQRDDLHVLEVAAAYVKLMEEFNFEFDDLSKATGKAETTIRNMIRLLSLPEAARTALITGEITEGHARQVLAAPAEYQDELLKHIQTKGWSVRQAEQFVKSLKTGTSAKKAVSKTASQNNFTRTLQKSLGLKVRQQNMAKGGRIVIDFKTDSDLEKILEKLK